MRFEAYTILPFSCFWECIQVCMQKTYWHNDQQMVHTACTGGLSASVCLWLEMCFVHRQRKSRLLSQTQEKLHSSTSRSYMYPCHMPTLRIEPGLKQWKASALSTELISPPRKGLILGGRGNVRGKLSHKDNCKNVNKDENHRHSTEGQ